MWHAWTWSHMHKYPMYMHIHLDAKMKYLSLLNLSIQLAYWIYMNLYIYILLTSPTMVKPFAWNISSQTVCSSPTADIIFVRCFWILWFISHVWYSYIYIHLPYNLSNIEWDLTNGPCLVSCDRAMRYSGFFQVRIQWVRPLEISWIQISRSCR